MIAPYVDTGNKDEFSVFYAAQGWSEKLGGVIFQRSSFGSSSQCTPTHSHALNSLNLSENFPKYCHHIMMIVANMGPKPMKI